MAYLAGKDFQWELTLFVTLKLGSPPTPLYLSILLTAQYCHSLYSTCSVCTWHANQGGKATKYRNPRWWLETGLGGYKVVVVAGCKIIKFATGRLNPTQRLYYTSHQGFQKVASMIVKSYFSYSEWFNERLGDYWPLYFDLGLKTKTTSL